MNDLSSLKGTYLPHLGGFSTGPFRDPFCFSLLCRLSTHKVFRRLFLSLNICSFEEGLWSPELLLFGPAVPSTYSSQGFGPSN
jgi:hypothetical protein